MTREHSRFLASGLRSSAENTEGLSPGRHRRGQKQSPGRDHGAWAAPSPGPGRAFQFLASCQKMGGRVGRRFTNSVTRLCLQVPVTVGPATSWKGHAGRPKCTVRDEHFLVGQSNAPLALTSPLRKNTQHYKSFTLFKEMSIRTGELGSESRIPVRPETGI